MATNAQATDSVEDIQQSTFSPRAADPTYRSHWKQFCTWVNRTEGVSSTNGKYLTRDNIDKYFLLVVQTQTTKWRPKHAEKAKYALQHFADNVEYPPPVAHFTVDSISVKQALRAQKEGYKRNGPNRVGCAHANLPTETLTSEEETTLIMYGAQTPAWRDYCASITSMTQTTIRADQIRRTRLTDLRCDDVHGPPSGVNDKPFPMIALIQQPYVGKRGSERKRVAGMWRHLDWWKCGTGWLAASLMFRLYNDDNIHFRHTDKTQDPAWYDQKLLSWESYPAMYAVYDRNYKATKISWSKVLHFRTQGADKISNGGCSKDEVEGHTKHGKDALSVSYWTELPPGTLLILAGFKKGQAYFVDRWYINVNDVDFPLVEGRTDLTKEELAAKLLPYYQTWLEQHENGLKWESSSNFLKETIPLLALIFVQDGIFRTELLEHHEASRLLVHAFGDRYKEWASRQRDSIKDLAAADNRERIQALNSGTQDAIVSLKGDNISLKNNVKEMGNTLNQMYSLLQQQLPQLRQPIMLQPQRRAATAATVPATRNQRLVGRLASGRTLELSNSTPPPLIPKELPATLRQLLEQHIEHDLENYKGVAKQGEAWRSVKMQLSRRFFLYELIEKRAEPLRGTPDFRHKEAARRLDVERGTMTVSQFLGHKKKEEAKKRRVTPVPGGRKRTRQFVQFQA
jgi:hypothetical protein